MTVSRRSFLAGIASSSLLTTPALALSAPTVRLSCLHTGATCEINFDGSISSRDAEAFRRATWDWRRHTAYKMDLELIPLLAGISKFAGSDHTFGLISGYRTPETNRALNGTATKSYHMKGQALDIRRSDMRLSDLREAATRLQIGGVGYYPQPRNNFVHVDTGPVRYW